MAQNLHFIEIQYISASKVKITSLFFYKDSITIPGKNIAYKEIELFQQNGFKIIGYGPNIIKTNTTIYASTTFQRIEPLKDLYKTLGENPFKSLKVTSQKPTKQKPTNRYKKCI